MIKTIIINPTLHEGSLELTLAIKNSEMPILLVYSHLDVLVVENILDKTQ